MKSLNDGVVEQLKLQRATDDTIALWEELWACLESDDPYAAGDFIAGLMELPGDDNPSEDAR